MTTDRQRARLAKLAKQLDVIQRKLEEDRARTAKYMQDVRTQKPERRAKPRIKR